MHVAPKLSKFKLVIDGKINMNLQSSNPTHRLLASYCRGESWQYSEALFFHLTVSWAPHHLVPHFCNKRH